MSNTQERRDNLLNRRTIVIILLMLLLGGLGGALLQRGGYLLQMLEPGEKKLTASGVDSVMIEYDYKVNPNPVRGFFNRATEVSQKETLEGEIKGIDVYDEGGELQRFINCRGPQKCKITITGQGGSVIQMNDGMDADNGKIVLDYVKTGPGEHRASPREKWGFLRSFRIMNINLYENDYNTPTYTLACPTSSPLCSVDVTYTYPP